MQYPEHENDQPTRFREWVEALVAKESSSPKLLAVMRAITASPSFASRATAAQMAERAGVNASTIVRIAQKLGFNGWPVFQNEITAQYLSELDANQLLELHRNSVLDESDRRIRAVQSDVIALQTLSAALPNEPLDEFVDLLNGARRILLLGSGSYSGVLVHFAHVASRIGVDVALIGSEGRTVPVDLSRAAPDDVLLVLSLWRTPYVIETTVELASQRGLTVLLIADTRQSPLAEFARHTILVPAEGTSHFPSLTASASLVHVLLTQLADVRGDSARSAIAEHERTYLELERLRRRK